MSRVPFSKRLTAIVLGAVIAAACSDAGTSTSPARTSAASATFLKARAGTQERKEQLGGIACTTKKAASDSGTFGPSGGTLVFGDSKLVIPAGALAKPVFITAHAFGDSTSRVDFSPSGLQFTKAAGLVLGTADCDMSGVTAPNVVYLSPTGEILETIQAVYDPHWKTVAAPIVHFSGYAIAF